MIRDIVIPDVGESVQEAILAEWFVRSGEFVRKDTVLFVLETDKVTLEVTAEADGVVEILVSAGETVKPGMVVGRLDTTAAGRTAEPPSKEEPAADVPAGGVVTEREPEKEAVEGIEPPVAPESRPLVSPSAARLAAELAVDLSRVRGTGPGGRITKGDVLLVWESRPSASRRPEKAPSPLPPGGSGRPDGIPPDELRKPLSPIRKRIAQRLLQAKHSTAMLTTFNEVDMSRVMAFRRRFKTAFKEKYGVSLGIMSFFVKACVAALQEIPEVNAFIDGDHIVYHPHVHMGVAIGAEKGLVVPVIRNAHRLSFAEIERAIVTFVEKIRENRLEPADLEGGTFTISNGGVYGSLLSTPILNPPQSGILGLHKIEDRPVAVEGRVEVRPMMYVALTYDHRIIDGREAVTFLRRVKEYVEDPERMMVGV